MNSKKLVSLLSAGALVLSSFSGLMMNGSVAHAATTLAMTGSIYTKAGGNAAGTATEVYVYQSATDIVAKFTASAAAAYDAQGVPQAGAAQATHDFFGSIKTATTLALVEDDQDATKGKAGDAITFNGMTATPKYTNTNAYFEDELSFTAGSKNLTAVLNFAEDGADTKNVKINAITGLVTTDGEAPAATKYRVDGDGITLKINKALTGDAATWQLAPATSFELSAEAGSETTITLADGAEVDDIAQLTVTLDQMTAVITLIADENSSGGADEEDYEMPKGAIPYAVFEAVDADGTKYTDGAATLTVQVPRYRNENESNAEWAEYIRKTTEKNLTLNAFWTAAEEDRKGVADTTKFTVKADNWSTVAGQGKVPYSVWETGALTVNGDDYTKGTFSSAEQQSYGLVFRAPESLDATSEGKFIVTATGTVKGKTYYGQMTINVKVLVADGAGVELIAGSNNTNLVNKNDWDAWTTDIKPLGNVANIKKYGPSVTLDNGETGAASLRWRVDWTTGTVSADNLKYAWSFVKDNGGTTTATSKWIADDEANKIFTMTGTDEERVTFMPTTYVLGGDYILRGEIKTAGGNLVAVAYVNIHLVAEAGSSLSVVVNTSKLEKGYVEVPAATTVVEEVTVKVTRGNGSDVTKDSDISYAIVPFADYITAKNQNRLANLGSAYGLSIDKDKTALKIQHSAEPGAYVVVVKDGKLDNYAVDEENLIQVKSGSGLDVTGLQVDQNTVTITNLNSEKCVWATVLPTEYQDNGYTKVAAKSAEVNAIKYTVADPSVVDVTLVAGHQYLQTTHEMDNTWNVWIRARKVGNTTVTLTTLDGGFTQVIDVTVLGTEPTPTPEPTPEHKAGDAFTVDGVSVFVNADGKTLTVTDVAVVGKSATIPATVDGMDVTTIAAQAFKKSDAKTVYVKASVTDIEKGAFKKAKTKKVYFYDPAALETVAKNAFKGANVKVVGVGGNFSESAASQLKKAGASKVKNNGTAK